MRRTVRRTSMLRFMHVIPKSILLCIVGGLIGFAVVVGVGTLPDGLVIHPSAVSAAQSAPQIMDVSPVPDQPFVAIAKRAKASVVNIASVKKRSSLGNQGVIPFFEAPFFRRFFGEDFGSRNP